MIRYGDSIPIIFWNAEKLAGSINVLKGKTWISIGNGEVKKAELIL